jgi:hypothetical protein
LGISRPIAAEVQFCPWSGFVFRGSGVLAAISFLIEIRELERHRGEDAAPTKNIAALRELFHF